MTDATVAGGPGLLERLAAGPVICAEGYLFEIERRGYLSAGAYVPEAVLEHPDTVARLHRDFLHAGSDVMLAFTYYAHREKLRLIGKEDALEEINRTALRLAREAALEGDALVAGNVCNSNVFVDGDPELIILVDYGFGGTDANRTFLESNPALSGMSAVVNGQYMTLTFLQSVPGPPNLDGLIKVATAVRRVNAAR